MRRLYLLPLAVVVAALLALPGTAAATSCSGSLSKGFWTHITATHVSCTSAKTLIKKWITKVGFGQVDPPPSVKVGAYTCKIKFSSSQGEAGKLTCTASGSRKVTTVGSP
ncbi:MAG TPA: hypothetical protein VHR88_12405 [Solirubrobacteraceae bacterium]|jgi:hypothetical protein|nr:hypothetical protein [Solirubrobacteraceae bacterium]